MLISAVAANDILLALAAFAIVLFPRDHYPRAWTLFCCQDRWHQCARIRHRFPSTRRASLYLA